MNIPELLKERNISFHKLRFGQDRNLSVRCNEAFEDLSGILILGLKWCIGVCYRAEHDSLSIELAGLDLLYIEPLDIKEFSPSVTSMFCEPLHEFSIAVDTSMLAAYVRIYHIVDARNIALRHDVGCLNRLDFHVSVEQYCGSQTCLTLLMSMRSSRDLFTRAYSISVSKSPRYLMETMLLRAGLQNKVYYYTRPREMMVMALDFYDVVYGRRSVRIFEEKQVEARTLKKILETTLAAPSAHNAQPARFFVIPRGKMRDTMLQQMAEAHLRDLLNDKMEERKAREVVERSKMILQNAPILVLVGLTMKDMWAYPDDKRKSHEYIMAVQSTAASVQNLLLAAFCEGVASCWLCAPLFARNVVVEALGIDRNIDPQAFIILGYSSKKIDMPGRKAFEEVVHML